MLPDAYVCHQLTGRVRVKVADKRGELTYFSRACRELSTVTGVVAVSANPVTGSIVVNGVSLRTLAEEAQARELFRLVGAENGTVRAQTRRSLERVSDDLARISGGAWNFDDALFLALIGFAVHEAVNGRFAAPAVTLAWYAFNTLAIPDDRIGSVRMDG